MHPTTLDVLKLRDMEVSDVLSKWKIVQNLLWKVYSFYAGVTIGRHWILLRGQKNCVVKDLSTTTTTHAVFYLSPGFAVASWFRNGLLGDETDPYLHLVTREIHYCVSTWLDLILTGEYLHCIVEGIMAAIGPQNKTHAYQGIAWINIWPPFFDNVPGGFIGQ